MESLKPIIESLLFVAQEPLTLQRLKRVLAPAETSEIRAAIAEIATDYQNRQGGFYLHEVAGGYQIRTRPEYNQWIKKLIQPRPVRLSKAALETLAIIAYKQPIIRSDIEHIRGVDCGGVLRVLLERKLVRVLGRKEIPGRPLIYATTKRFLEVFDLKNLRDLPTPKEIEELVAADSPKNPEDSEDSADTAITTEPPMEVSKDTEMPTIKNVQMPAAPPAATETAESEIPLDTLRQPESTPPTTPEKPEDQP